MDNNKLVSDLSGILNGLDSSQEQLEKDAFDVKIGRASCRERV